jgi:putative hydrolase of the HAD superfamily
MAESFILLDVGGVLLVPHAEPIGASLGMSVPPQAAERAHYAGACALDATDGSQPAERAAYLEAYVRSLGIDRPTAIRDLQRLFSAGSLTLWRQQVEGSFEALRRLGRAGRRLAIVSNSDGTVEEQLRRGQICQVGEGLGVPVLAIIDSGVVGVSKPAAEIFRHAIEPLGVEAAACIYVGDTVRYDVMGARAAGIRPVHFDPYALCPQREDHAHVRRLNDLLESGAQIA